MPFTGMTPFHFFAGQVFYLSQHHLWELPSEKQSSHTGKTGMGVGTDYRRIFLLPVR